MYAIRSYYDGAKGDFKRKSIPSPGRFLMIYIVRLFVGITSTRGTEELLEDYGVMKLLGFEHKIIKHGIADRGKANQHGRKYQRKAGIVITTYSIHYTKLYEMKGSTKKSKGGHSK